MKRKLFVSALLMSTVFLSNSSFSGWSNPWAYVNYLQNKWSATRNQLQNMQLDESLINQVKQIETLFAQLDAMKAQLNVKGLVNNKILWGKTSTSGEGNVMTGTAEAELMKFQKEERAKYGEPVQAAYFQSKGSDKNMAQVYQDMNENAEHAAIASKFHFQKFNKSMDAQLDLLKQELGKAGDGSKERTVAQHMADQTRILVLMLLLQRQTADLIARLNSTMSIEMRSKVEGKKSRLEMYNNRKNRSK